MNAPESTDGPEAAALVNELFKAAMEATPRSIFVQRALIKRALQEIQRRRANRDFDPVFDGDHSVLQKVVRVHHTISGADDHHIRAAMLLAAELLDMLRPFPVSPQGRALRKRGGGRMGTEEGEGADGL